MSLYPPIEPFMSDFLQVSSLHSIYFEQCGKKDGYPILFLHGGPGGGCQLRDRRFFDPSFFRIILFDQRGAGRSRPHACLEANTTWDLVADIEKLRERLGISKWAVFGGSWGSTLALAYAETHPDHVTSLTLRGIFTLRRAELLWFYQEGASFIMPDYWEEYLAPIPPDERQDLMRAYYRRLIGPDTGEKLRCAKAWSTWECATAKLYVDAKNVQRGSDPQWALAFARIECKVISKIIARIYTSCCTYIEGRYDLVCPMRTCWDLHKQFPEADIIIVDDNGHSSSEPGIERELVLACNRLRDDLARSQFPSTPTYAPTHATVIPTWSSPASTRPPTTASSVKQQEYTLPSTPSSRVSTARRQDASPYLENVLHKRPLQPPGGVSHNIFG
eukprot:gene7970-10044_t